MPAPNNTYTHGSTSGINRLRLLAGDHRGTAGASTGWQFSDEELADILLVASSDLPSAVRICLQIAAQRAAYVNEVIGTNPTSDLSGRAGALIAAAGGLAKTPMPLFQRLPTSRRRELADVDHALEEGS